ncbi:hypothetical protein LTS18_008682 [Coniosporium uncinatum]|uniref:Uncharacterized protein n=1 Tax=Coniosporium uncinatum TaxID=93489 RepID=A0ACC3DA36_9PEZI|nr:hypothetical protein LTS18_008682 [Coniosporium uncinatum]
MADNSTYIDPESGIPLTAIDREVLATKDEDLHLITWDELKDVIATKNLEALKRTPSALRAYLTWSAAQKRIYGTVPNYILRERLHWIPLEEGTFRFKIENPTPFADSRDYRILRNDWPYALGEGIVHIVVWLKTPLPVLEETGELTEEGYAMVRAFVKEKFTERLRDRDVLGREEKEDEKVLWFKNTTRLQSVRALEHVHVLVRGVPEELLEEWYA